MKLLGPNYLKMTLKYEMRFFGFPINYFLLFIFCFSICSNIFANPKVKLFGKEIAPLIDIAPKLIVAHDLERVRGEMAAIKSLGFKRVYLVLCNPGYPSFSNPVISPTTLHNNTNRTMESLLRLGDPNWVYLNEAKKQGLEVWAVFKPYESGSGNTIPHGQIAPLSMTHIPTIGGQYIHFDNLLSQNPQMAVKRKPFDEDVKRSIDQSVKSIEVSYCIDAFTQRVGLSKEIQNPDKKAEDIKTPVFEIWTSADNGKYTLYKESLDQVVETEMRFLLDANKRKLFEEKKKHLVIKLRNLNIPENHNYVSIVQKDGDLLSILPHSMINAFGDNGNIPLTIATYSRRPHDHIRREASAYVHEWGNEGIPVKDKEALKWFPQMGFEFEWYGVGFWGNGWTKAPVFGLAKGKRTHMKGTPCEAYSEVRQYWMNFVRQMMDMGFDGVDFRLQNHSGMVTDYFEYGYNQPIIDQYKKQYGIDILKEQADPLKIMKIRGDYYYSFLEEAAALIHSRGKKIKIHLRHADQEATVGDDWNELGFWAMPKIIIDWKKMVDLADEITLKHYYFNNYDLKTANQIKEYAKLRSKPIWVHAYIQQGNELNSKFLLDVEKDNSVHGIIMYELTNSFFSNKHPNNNMTNLDKLLADIGY